MKRYRLILLECEATSPSWWGKVVSSADKLAEVFEGTRCGYLAADQAWEIVDSRKGETISKERYYEIIAGR